MTIYPKIYADYQQSSCQSQTARIAGKQVWLTPNPKAEGMPSPLLVVVSEPGLTVQYETQVMHLDLNGTIQWTKPGETSPPVLADADNIYFRGIDGNLHGVDSKGKELFDEFLIPNCFSRGGLVAVMPVGDDFFILQTYNLAKEVEIDYPPDEDNYSIVLTSPTSDLNWKWLHKYEGLALPGLATNDRKKFVLLDNRSRVMVFDTDSGERLDFFEVQGAVFVGASIDRKDNLIIAMDAGDEGRKLCSYNLSGELNWEYALPPGGEWSHQPPAIDGNNRVYFLSNNGLLAIDDGRLAWTAPVPAGSTQYLTILGDNSIIVVGGIEIDQFDPDSKELLAVELADGAIITTPPVVDNKGRLYLGTRTGIYCLE